MPIIAGIARPAAPGGLTDSCRGQAAAAAAGERTGNREGDEQHNQGRVGVAPHGRVRPSASGQFSNVQAGPPEHRACSALRPAGSARPRLRRRRGWAGERCRRAWRSSAAAGPIPAAWRLEHSGPAQAAASAAGCPSSQAGSQKPVLPLKSLAPKPSPRQLAGRPRPRGNAGSAGQAGRPGPHGAPVPGHRGRGRGGLGVHRRLPEAAHPHPAPSHGWAQPPTAPARQSVQAPR